MLIKCAWMFSHAIKCHLAHTLIRRKHNLIFLSAEYWELDSTTAEVLEPTAKKAALPEGLQSVYAQRCAAF